MTLLLTNDEVDQLLPMEAAVDALRGMYAEVRAGRGVSGPRIDLLAETESPVDPHAEYSLKSMGGVLPRSGMAALRLSSEILGWQGSGDAARREKLPAADGRWVGLVLLFSTRTGEPLMIAPDGFIQRARVAGATALGARHLARADARVLALLGSGWQAEGQVDAYCATCAIGEIRVFSPSQAHREAFAERMARRSGVTVRPAESAERAVDGADIVASATNSVGVVLRPEWARPGMHFSSVTATEVPEGLVLAADHIAFQCLDMSRDAQTYRPSTAPPPRKDRPEWWFQQNAPFRARMSDLIHLTADAAPARTGDGEVTLFVNNAMALAFTAVGARVYEAARARDVGREIATSWLTQDVHP